MTGTCPPDAVGPHGTALSGVSTGVPVGDERAAQPSDLRFRLIRVVAGAVSWLRTSEWGVSRHRNSVSQVFGMAVGAQAAPCRSAATGELLRDLTIDPRRDYQPTGRPPGPAPKQ